MGYKPLRVFLDSNALLSGLVSESGAARRVLDLAELGIIQVVLSDLIIVEVDRNLQEHSFEHLLPLFRQYLLGLKPHSQPDPTKEQVLRAAEVVNVKDAPILAAALEAELDYFLTFDTKHFKTPAIQERVSFEIVTPSEFLESLTIVQEERE
jgi:predicted nucleic acid-binding protein